MSKTQQSKHSQKYEHPRCPRCGYDLRGITQTWQSTGSCPLTGKCSECGLDFDWYRVFRESEHPWLFELRCKHHPYSSFIKTILMTFRPRRFWRNIDITDTIHLGPLLFIPLFLSTILLLLRFGVALWSYSIARIGFVTLNPIAGKFSIKGLFNHWNSYSSWYWHGQVEPVFDVVFFTTLAWSAFILILFRFLPVSLRKCKIRKIHLIRVAIYSTIPLLIYLISWAFADVIFLLLHEQLQWPLNNIIEWSYLGLIEFVGVAWYIWQVIFWFFACRYYLKLPHAFWIALLLTSAAYLIIILIHVGWWNYQAHHSWSRIPHWQEQLFLNY